MSGRSMKMKGNCIESYEDCIHLLITGFFGVSIVLKMVQEGVDLVITGFFDVSIVFAMFRKA